MASALAVAAATLAILSKSSGSDAWIEQISIISIIWLFVYLSTTWLYFRNPYLFATAFIGPLCVFHLSWVYIQFFELEDIVVFHSAQNSGSYAVAAWYVLLALGSLGIGLAVAMTRKQRPLRRLSVDFSTKEQSLQLLFWMGIGLLAASSIFFAMFVIAVGNPLAYSRIEFFETGVAGRGLGAFLIVFPGAVTALLIGATGRGKILFAITLTILASVVLLFSGYRSAFFFPVLSGIVLYTKVRGHIPLWVSVIGLLAMVVIIPGIGKLRNIEYGQMNADSLNQSIVESRPIDTFIELGGTLGVLADALIVVPNKTSYLFGRSYFIAAQQAVPNIGLHRNESERASSRGRVLLDREAIFDLSPADWLTYYVDPWKFRVGQGVGFSGIAEPYINFGYVGVLFGFVLIGFLLGRFDACKLVYHPWLLVFAATLFWAFLKTVRNTSGNFIKPLVFVAVICAIWRLFSPIIPIKSNPFRKAA